MTKTCTKCGQELPLTEYYKHKAGKYGLFAECKVCYNVGRKQYNKENRDLKLRRYQENKDKILKQVKQYRAENKDKVIESKKRHYQKYKAEYSITHKKYREENKDKIAKWQKQYYEENKIKINEQGKLYRTNNPDKPRLINQRRKARKKELPSTLTLGQWELIKKEFDSKCAYCGKKTKLQQDHFVPLTKGGEYTHNNIIPACRSCNSSKNNTDFFEWYPKQDFYNKKRELKVLRHLQYRDTCQQLTIGL